MRLKGISLFSNVGVAEAYMERNNIDIVIANELEEDRAKFYKHLYPNTDMIIGDIRDDKIFKEIITKAEKYDIDFLIATPPCQGMSTAGMKDPSDPRNKLIVEVIKVIKEIKPRFILIENVTNQLKTEIEIDGKRILIPQYLKHELEEDYTFNDNVVVNAMDYGVPQSRERAIYLLARKDTNIKWEFGDKVEKIQTLRDAIGDLPSLDPFIKDITEEERRLIFPEYEEKRIRGLEISKWHYPPTHMWGHVSAMIHTPEGCSAFANHIYYPKKRNGEKSKGYNNTYKRQWWDKPAYTITRYTGRLGSQENGHPGRLILDDGTEEGRVYSDARVLTIYELLIVSSLPQNWDIPDWASNNLIREVIGEGIPPRFVEAAISRLTDKQEYEKMKIYKKVVE